jgi:tetratricopeptide (TPR) repeat protein
LLEYDPDGDRYSDKARLKDAVAELRELKKLDSDYARTYDDNVLFDLWYAHDYQAVLDLAATLPTSDARKGLMLAATAVQQGPDAALKKSLEITTSDQVRSQVLVNAGSVLVRVRKYPEAAALLTDGAHGQANGSQTMRSADIFRRTRLYSEMKMEASDPRSVVQQLFSEMMSGNLTMTEFRSIIFEDPQNPETSITKEQFDQLMATFRAEMGETGLPLTVITDLAVSNMHYTVDGDDSLGYKIIVEFPGAAPEDIFVIRDAGLYKIAGFSVADAVAPEELGSIALEELDKGNLAAARKWLDRARDKIHISGGDDPLGDQPFPYFWTKGQDADAASIRTAALVLIPSNTLKAERLSTLLHARAAAKSELDAARITLVAASAYSAQERWAEMLPLSLELTKSFPSSLRAFGLATSAYAGLKRYQDWDKLVQARIVEHPDEFAYVRSSALLAAFQGQFAKSREILKSISDKGQATGSDLNQYAWFALAMPLPIAQETIDMGIRANDLSKNGSFAILHTLGCVYAQAGKTTEARELLLKAMNAQHMEEPNSEIWFGFGLIAEQYGVVDAAENMFARIEKPKTNYPATTYELAQEHLTTLRKTKTAAAKSAGL